MVSPLDGSPALLDHPALGSDLEHAVLLRGQATEAELLEAERCRLRAVIAGGGWGCAERHGLTLVRPLPWDSAHFGVSSADLVRLYWSAEGGHPGELGALIDATVKACRRRGTILLGARLLGGQVRAVQLLEAHGFRHVDTSVELGALLPLPLAAPRAGAEASIREPHPEDHAALAALARTFQANRFHRDPDIPRAKARALYERWVLAAAAGRHGRLLVAELEAQIAGFASYWPADPHLGVGVIGLVIVDPGWRGHGLVGRLVRACAARAGGRAVVTSTQVSNIAAQRAFIRCGLAPVGARQVMHGWL